MTDIQWGDPIVKGGDAWPAGDGRPRWLGDDDRIWMHWASVKWSELRDSHPLVSDWSEIDWKSIDQFRLTDNHFAYRAIAAGMVPWGGGDEEPGDWDEKEILYRDGNSVGRFPHTWRHIGNPGDIIGYRRKPAIKTDTVTIERMTEAEARALWYRSDDEGEPVMTANIAVKMLHSLNLIKPDPEEEAAGTLLAQMPETHDMREWLVKAIRVGREMERKND